MKRRIRIVLGLFLAAIIFFCWYINVPKSVSSHEKIAIQTFLGSVNGADQFYINEVQFDDLSFEDQVKQLQLLSETLLDSFPQGVAVPKNQNRSLRALLKNKEGQCYDRSYVFEAILRTKGAQTRHAYVFETHSDESALQLLRKKKVKTHAVSEVKTKKGWIVVDPNVDWISLSATGEPKSLDCICENRESIQWDQPIFGDHIQLYSGNCRVVYGLYSRHGRFFAPFNPIPDVNFRELAFNI